MHYITWPRVRVRILTLRILDYVLAHVQPLYLTVRLPLAKLSDNCVDFAYTPKGTLKGSHVFIGHLRA